MQGNIQDAIAERRSRKARAWIQIVVGLGLVVAGIALTVWSFKSAVKHHDKLYIAADGPVVAGFLVFARGLWRLLGGNPDDALVLPSRKTPEQRGAPPMLAVGFRSFVAYRYLMARDHRVRKVVLFFLLVFAFLAVTAFALEHTVMTLANPLGLDPETLTALAQLTSIVKVAGFVLVIFALIVGALRYVFSFFTTVPLVGVWIGTGALVCVLSVMSGFESDLRTKILGSNAHIQVTREDGEMADWRDIKKRIDAVPGVVASTPYAVSEVVIAANNNGMNVIIKGIDPNTVGKVTELERDLEDRQAMKRLAPLVDDEQHLQVPQPPAPQKSTVDPAPADMPTRGDPIDFSQPAGETADAGAGSAEPAPMGPPPAAATDTGDPVMDPPPPDLVTSDEPPIDYSKPREGDPDPVIHPSDLPVDASLSRRTQSLPGILVGRELVKQTHLYTGEEVRLVSPLSDPSNPDATGTPIPFNRDYRVAGIFFTGMYEYDLKYVYVSLDSLQDFLDRGDTVDGIEVRIGSPDDTDAYVKKLGDVLGPTFRVQDWKELNRSLFSALKLEKIAMFLVLGIVILVASFSIVGNLIMVVVEKGREIALLKTLGASDAKVMHIFAIQGLLIGLIGTLIGIGTGLAACYIGKEIGIPLNPDVYYIDKMPVHVEMGSVIVTAIAGVGISIMATFYPSLLAARVRPAAGMRH